MANVKISALPAGSAAAGGDVPMVQAGVTNKLTLGTLAYQAANAVAITGGTIAGLTSLTIANAGTLTPASSDGAALGTTALMWADLFLASGSVVNFNNGDVTITHAANTLTFAGATTTGYQFQDGPLRPVANDGIALGVSGTAFADLFLATGGVINWNAADVTITHAANTLTFSGAATNGYQFQDGPLRPVADDGIALGVSGTAFADLFLASGGVINWNAGDVTITHSSNTLAFAGAATAYTFNGGAVRPSANDGVALGTNTVSWADLFLASGGVINWNDGDVTITHGTDVLTVSGGNLVFPGSVAGDEAAAGIVGEIIQSTVLVGSAVALTTNTTANVTSIALTAGDWDIWGAVWFSPAATTSITRQQGAISLTSATLPTAPGENGGNGGGGYFAVSTIAKVPNAQEGFPTGTMRFNLNSGTTIRLVAQATFTVSTLSAYGYIAARRRR